MPARRDDFRRFDERTMRIWSGLRDAEPRDALARIAQLAAESSRYTELFFVGELFDMFLHDHLDMLRDETEAEVERNPGLRGALSMTMPHEPFTELYEQYSYWTPPRSLRYLE